MRAFNCRRSLLAALLLLPATLIWFNADAIFKRGHLAGSSCETCHLARGKIGRKNAHQLVSSQEQLCGNCHEDSIKVSHPSGINVKRKLPKQFPLDWKNDLTCSTCHDVHGHDSGLMRIVDRGPQMCLKCHDEKFFDRMRDGGESLMISGHVNAGAYQPIDNSDLDRYSLQCLQCHAGQFTSDKFRITRTILRHGDNRVNHPIGSTYSAFESYGGYRKISALKAEILLPNGRLACVSCHLGYSGQHGELVAARGRLCYECHDL